MGGRRSSPTTDHPRSRGVYFMIHPAYRTGKGSSPLARGLRCGDCCDGDDPGIIPARAGFTRVARWRAAVMADHPRSRGVYLLAHQSPLLVPGSSPLARGLRWRSTRPGTGPGIIPARAGFTSSAIHASARPSDHPRSRGVYRELRLNGASGFGSSPLARGLPDAVDQRIRELRIIPARAGFTPAHCVDVFRADGSSPLARGLRRWCRPRGGGQWDHPRSRGVYRYRKKPIEVEAGSSPLARGLRPAEPQGREHGRIIPARAGFTSQINEAKAAGEDHPRSRGVYYPCQEWTSSSLGSSPLARGLRAGACAGAATGRIIPARAGFTPGPCPSPVRERDHPRSRGVYQETLTQWTKRQGSSPLARGLRCWCVGGGPAPGIIPARAGFTHPGGP